MDLDLLGLWVAAILTLLVFSYLVADTLLFRLAQAVFVGVSIGYGTSLVIHRVLLQGLVIPMFTTLPAGLVYLVPLVLGFLLLTKYRTGGEFWSVIGNLPLGYLFGVGAALAIGGALSGLLIPQFAATARSLIPASGGLGGLLNNLLLLFGTLGVLLAFRFTTGFQSGPLASLSTVAKTWGRAGRVFILVALGALFASALMSRVSVLINQLYFLLHDWLGIIR